MSLNNKETRRTNRHWLLLLVVVGSLFVVAHNFPVIPSGAQELEVTVDDGPPQWTYGGDTNNTQVEFEVGGAFTANWTLTDDLPDYYFIYWNQTGANTTRAENNWSDGETVESSYDPVYSDVGNTLFFQVAFNDTVGNWNSSLVYFDVVNTNPPTVSVDSPTNTTYTTSTIDITLSSASVDLALLWFSLYYINDTAIEENTTWTETVQRSLAVGQYYLIGYCNDTAGLEDSETVYFTVSTEVPTQGSPGLARIPKKLMEPLFPDVDFPLLGLLVSAVIGLGMQYSQADPTTQHQQQRKRVYIYGLCGIILYVILRVFDVFGWLRRILTFELPDIQFPALLGAMWGRITQPSILGWPLGGILIFAVLGLYQSNNYHPTDPTKKQIKRGFLVLCGLALIYTALEIANIPQLLSDALANEVTIPTIRLAPDLELAWARLNTPIFPFTDFFTVLSLLVITGMGIYMLYTTRPPKTEPRRNLRTVVAILVIGGLIYALVVMFNLTTHLEGVVTWLVDIYR